MDKKYRVRNHKKTDHIYTVVSDCAEYIDALAVHADRTAFVWKENGAHRELSYSDFVSLVKDFSLGLTETLGNQGGAKTVAVIGETSPYWIASYLGIISSGNIALPLDKELDPAEIAKFLEQANVSAVVYSRTFADVFPKIAAESDKLNTLIPMNSDDDTDTAADSRIIPYDAVLLAGRSSSLHLSPDCDTERLSEILFTSGTTGSSKCVMLCQRNIFSVVSSACQAVDFRADDVLVSVLPLHHTYELACTLAAMDYGCKICINDSLRYVLKNFKEYKPTALILVPMFVTTMYKKIQSEAKRAGKEKMLSVCSKVAHYLSFAGIDMSERLFRDVREAFGGRLEKIICGGAALNPEMIEVFETFGISIYEGYGITECAPLVAVTPYYKRKCGSVGPSVACCKVRIGGSSERVYEKGEIQVQGDNVMLGYAANDAANAEAFTDDGWFRTGDIGFMDGDGYIYITGRQKSVIVLDNGKNVFPEEIEEYLEGIDTIAESVVVGRVDDETSGETKLIAVIYPAYDRYKNLSENELRAEIQKSITELNKRLPSFKQIHKLEFRKTEFEKTTTKKIKRHLVK